jgi:branched-chain amino acid transport system permease protein
VTTTDQRSSSSAADGEAEIERCFARHQRARLAAIVSAQLVEEHRTAPVGDHSPALTAVLTALRQAPVAGKLALLETKVGEEWMIIRLSGERGVPHDLSDTARYTTLDAALHAVFLRRLAALGVFASPEEPR